MIARFIKYSIVASLSALSDWLIFIMLSFVNVNPVAALGFSRIFGGLVSFLSNRYWSFAANVTISKFIQGRRFLLLYIVSYGLALGIFYVLTVILNLNIFLSKLITDVVCFVFNFTVMNFYVFHKRTGFIHWIKLFFQQS